MEHSILEKRKTKLYFTIISDKEQGQQILKLMKFSDI